MLKSICIILKLCHSITGEASVIDGDTIRIERIHIRLAGLDAEELNEPHGRDARYALLRLTYDRIVTCNLNGEKSYNRYVGTCSANGKDLASEMVRQGAALDCAFYSKGKYRSLEPSWARSKLIQKPYC